jgi:excisionase family DNA binding protein
VPAPVAIANRERLDVADHEYLTPTQVADELQVTVVTVRRWIANRELRAMKAGPRRWMIRRSDLNAFLAAGRQSDADVEISEDPSFSKHLVAPDER